MSSFEPSRSSTAVSFASSETEEVGANVVAKAAADNPKIRPLGYVDGRALVDVYAQSDALIVPSHYEPWGLVVHEGPGARPAGDRDGSGRGC